MDIHDIPALNASLNGLATLLPVLFNPPLLWNQLKLLGVTVADVVLDKGHLFGVDLPDSDKAALIEYMKTF